MESFYEGAIPGVSTRARRWSSRIARVIERLEYEEDDDVTAAALFWANDLTTAIYYSWISGTTKAATYIVDRYRR